jgi:hypothetical protein
MPRSTYTRSGTRRLGDYYQDLIACEVLIDWLEHSERYVWVRVEGDESKFLDDVEAMRSDGRLLVKQVKFSTDPEGENDPLTWEKLLAEPPGKSNRKRMSLLEKWATSWRELFANSQLVEASVVSNRIAGPDLQATLNATTGLVDFDRTDNEVRTEIVRQLGGAEAARQFFEQFRFSLNEPSLKDLEGSLRRRFGRLGGTETGWLSLLSEVRFWVSHNYEPPPDGRIKLSDVMRAARWHALQSLPQRFTVPPDYELPSEEFHINLRNALLSTGNGCHVITASPGVGKSTYTSHLYDQLKEQGTPVIRHHYYLSQDDQTGVVRLAHMRAAESLMFDLNHDYAKALGTHAGDNPVGSNLREWLIAAGSFYSKERKRLIVIVDGLDHVWRDTQSVDELAKLLNFMLPAPEGVMVLLATQPVDDSQLPSVVLKYAPRETWSRLPLMDQRAVVAWLHHHESELLSPAVSAMVSNEGHLPEFQFQRLGEALYEKSSGHPLHLRYTLKSLQERDQLITVENIERLPGCAHDDIRDYYRELWRVLRDDSRGILHLLAANRFAWPKRGIFECLSPDGTGYSALNNSLRQVEHLLTDDGTGLTPFHASLLAFIEALPEHADYRTAMRRNALSWLRRDAPDYARWAHEWMLEADLGDDRTLRDGPSREWLIQSIASRYPRGQMLNILSRSIWCSLQAEDLPRAIEVGLLHDYCFRAFQYEAEFFEQLLFAQLAVAEDEQLRRRLRARIERLTESEISILAEHEAGEGNLSFGDECLDELARQTRAEPGETHLEWIAQAEAIIEVAAFLDEVNPARVIDFVVRNRDSADVANMLNTFAFRLRTTKNGLRFKRTLALKPIESEEFNLEITAEERSYILHHAVWLALEEGFSLDDEVRQPENTGDPHCVIYAAIRKPEDFTPIPARLPNVQMFASKRSSPTGPSRLEKDLFYSCLSGFLANHLWGMGQLNAEWIATVGHATKTARCLQWLDTAALRVGESIKAGQAPSFGLLYAELKNLEDPLKSDAYNTEAMGLRNSIARALKHFALDLLSAAVAIEGKAEISKSDLELAFASGYCYWDGWMKEYIKRRRCWLSEEAFSWLLQSQTEHLETTIEQFPERTSTYGLLASVAALHGREAEARGFINNAASNAVAHGNHKDVLFFHVLHSVRTCHLAGIIEAREWLLRLATPIAHAGEFTDGDETGNLPSELAEILLDVAPDRFPAYYAWLCDREDSYDALHAFNSFIKTADFSSPLNLAIAATTLDAGSLKLLSERARQDSGAQAAVGFVQEVIGEKGLEQSLREEPRSGNDRFERKPSPVPPGDYQPENFEAYLSELEANEHIWKEDAVEEWINYWLAEKRDEAVFSAVERAVARGVELRDYDRIFELALSLYGRERAYPWLVKAHTEQRGWNRYYSGDEKTNRRWGYIDRLYPERWFDFIKQTLQKENGAAPWQDLYLDSSRAARLIEFCVRLNKLEVARETTKRFVNGSLELVELLRLPEPAWKNET